MKEHDMTELAFRNGYEACLRDMRKPAHWISGWDYCCSACGNYFEYKTKFCPNCGKPMVEGARE